MKRYLVLLAMLLAGVCSCFAGTTYTFTTSTEANGAKSATRSRVWATNGSVKVLFIQSDEASTPPSSYILRPAGAAALYLVYPDKKSYVRWTPGQGLQASSSMFKVLEPRFEKTAEESGGNIAGFKTTHYVFQLTYTMRAEMLGHPTDTPVKVEQEYWVADDARLKDIRAASLIQSEAGLSQLVPELQHTVSEETDGLRGVPLKTLMRFIMKLPAGEERTAMTSEISEVKAATIPAATFRIPPGYRRITPKLAEVEDEPQHRH